jgi:hypothetical protein
MTMIAWILKTACKLVVAAIAAGCLAGFKNFVAEKVKLGLHALCNRFGPRTALA